MVDERFERSSNLARIFVRENTHDRKRMPVIRHGAIPYMLREDTSRGLVVCNVEDPLNWPRNHLKSARKPDASECLTHCLLIQHIPGTQRFDCRESRRGVAILNRAREGRGGQAAE